MKSFNYHDILWVDECWIKILQNSTNSLNNESIFIENDSENFIIKKTAIYQEKYETLQNNIKLLQSDFINLFVKKIILKSYNNNKYYNYNKCVLYSQENNILKFFGKDFKIIEKKSIDNKPNEELWQIM